MEVSFDVITRHGDEVTIFTGIPARWEYIRKNEFENHVYLVVVEESQSAALERALGVSGEVVDYQRAIQ